MNKNHSKDGFCFYKLQFEKDYKGKTFNKGVTDIAMAALDSWKRMTLQQREPFKDLAKKAAKPKIAKPKVKTFSETHDRSYAEKTKKVLEMVSHSLLNGTNKTQEYYFVAANVFCKTTLNQYCPAELALLKFTLQDGVKDTFHTYINPENIPMGYRFEAIDLANKTHQLPIPPNAKGVKDFAQVLDIIDEFIASEDEFVPLFTMDENIPMIESLMQQFCLAGKHCNRRRFNILSINELFFEIKNRFNVDGTSRFKSIDDATMLLNGEKFLYLNQIACQFHEENDCSKYCCLAAVKRYAYAISDNICIDLNITIVTGKHYPLGVDYTPQSFEQVRTDNLETAAGSTKFGSDNRFELKASDDSKFHYVDYRESDLNSTKSTNFSELDRLREGNHLSDSLGSLRLSERGERFGHGRSFGRGRFGRDCTR